MDISFTMDIFLYGHYSIWTFYLMDNLQIHRKLKHPEPSYFMVINMPVGAKKGGGGLWGIAPRDFEKSVNPIPTMGADYAHHITT